MTERRPGQDGQKSGDSCFVRRIEGPDGTVYRARDADYWLRKRNSLEEEDGAVGVYVSPFTTLGAVQPTRGRSTRPRIPSGDLP